MKFGLISYLMALITWGIVFYVCYRVDNLIAMIGLLIVFFASLIIRTRSLYYREYLKRQGNTHDNPNSL